MKWFRVYNGDRTIRKIVKTEHYTISELLENASNTFRREFTTLTLEGDGTIIDQDGYLQDPSAGDVFVALQENEEWCPPILNSTASIPVISSPEIESRHPVMRENVRNATMSSTISHDEFMKALNEPIVLQDISNVETTMASSSRLQEKREIRDKFRASGDIEIPWKRFKPDVLKAIAKKKKLTYEQSKNVTHEIVKFLVPSPKYVPEFVFDNVAKELAKQKPETFCLRDSDGTIFGTGHENWSAKLKYHYNYRNRPHMQTFEDQKLHKNVGNLRMNINLNCGNVNNRPDHVDPNDMFSYIREDVTEPGKSLEDVLKKWPQLTTLDGLREHFEKLCEVPLDKMRSQFEAQSERILNACDEKRSRLKKKNILEAEVAEISSSDEEPEVQLEEENVELDIKKLLAKIGEHFNEDSSVIFRGNNYKGKEDGRIFIEMKDETPLYAVLVDDICVYKTNCPWEAFELYYGAFYIFRAMYPIRASRILEFVQRFVMKQNPIQGSRSKAPLTKGSNRQVMTLIKKIINFF
ncbi:hypothetical protein DMENIID0001_111460 [Sergentomyia squamirostris]